MASAIGRFPRQIVTAIIAKSVGIKGMLFWTCRVEGGRGLKTELKRK